MTTAEQKIGGNTDTRTAILDATEQIMLEQGYAGVSSRKVAVQAGLKSRLLYYYFRTMDDLFMAVFQRLADAYSERFAAAIASDKPLHQLWDLLRNSASAKLVQEFHAVASHRPAIRAMITRSSKRDRAMLVAALTPILQRRAVHPGDLPPQALAVMMSSLARTLAREDALGISDAHAETTAFVERFLDGFEQREMGDAGDAARRA